MGFFLRIEARLPRKPAGLELSARLLALRPHWDIELAEDGLLFYLPYRPGKPLDGPAEAGPPPSGAAGAPLRDLDAELSALEGACARLESRRPGLEIALSVRRAEEAPPVPAPPALGPWRLIQTSRTSRDWPGPGRLLLPAGLTGSRRFWAGEDLLASALAEHFTPRPGAPETRGRALLTLAGRASPALAAAQAAGAGPAAWLGEPEALRASAEILALNRLPAAELLGPALEPPAGGRADQAARFGLIIIHLSPYLTARRLKALAGRLAPEGAILISGFAPGPQTAHLLRAAARAGLRLSASVSSGDWAALKLEAAPPEEELPPLTGSLVPELADPPEAFPEEPADGAEADEEGLFIEEDEDGE